MAVNITYEPRSRGSPYRGASGRFVKRTVLAGGVVEWHGEAFRLLMENVLEESTWRVALDTAELAQFYFANSIGHDTGFTVRSFYALGRRRSTYGRTPPTGRYPSTKQFIRSTRGGRVAGAPRLLPRIKLPPVMPAEPGAVVVGNAASHYIYLERRSGVMQNALQRMSQQQANAILRQEVRRAGGP